MWTVGLVGHHWAVPLEKLTMPARLETATHPTTVTSELWWTMCAVSNRIHWFPPGSEEWIILSTWMIALSPHWYLCSHLLVVVGKHPADPDHQFSSWGIVAWLFIRLLRHLREATKTSSLGSQEPLPSIDGAWGRPFWSFFQQAWSQIFGKVGSKLFWFWEKGGRLGRSSPLS